MKFLVLSREVVAGYESGYVQNILIDQNIMLSDSVVYACGSFNMIESANQKLAQHGLRPSDFYSDAFVSAIEGII